MNYKRFSGSTIGNKGGHSRALQDKNEAIILHVYKNLATGNVSMYFPGTTKYAVPVSSRLYITEFQVSWAPGVKGYLDIWESASVDALTDHQLRFGNGDELVTYIPCNISIDPGKYITPKPNAANVYNITATGYLEKI